MRRQSARKRAYVASNRQPEQRDYGDGVKREAASPQRRHRSGIELTCAVELAADGWL